MIMNYIIDKTIVMIIINYIMYIIKYKMMIIKYMLSKMMTLM